MKIGKWKKTTLLAICYLCSTFRMPVYASDGEEYITISVDAVDDNGNLKYALDTDDPSAFTDSNEFTIAAGTSHTIYVKDVAGNVTSQIYEPTSDIVDNGPTSSVDDGQKINIDLEIGQGSEKKNDSSNFEYRSDEQIEPGTGTVAEKIRTDGSEDAERIFYTFTTKEGAFLLSNK